MSKETEEKFERPSQRIGFVGDFWADVVNEQTVPDYGTRARWVGAFPLEAIEEAIIEAARKYQRVRRAGHTMSAEDLARYVSGTLRHIREDREEAEAVAVRDAR